MYFGRFGRVGTVSSSESRHGVNKRPAHCYGANAMIVFVYFIVFLYW